MLPGRNCERKIMSTDDDCGNDFIDFYDRDNGEGSQYWKVTEVQGKPGYFTIQNKGKGNGCRTYVMPDLGNGRARLDYADDWTGMFHWRIPGLKSELASTSLRNVVFLPDQASYSN